MRTQVDVLKKAKYVEVTVSNRDASWEVRISKKEARMLLEDKIGWTVVLDEKDGRMRIVPRGHLYGSEVYIVVLDSTDDDLANHKLAEPSKIVTKQRYW